MPSNPRKVKDIKEEVFVREYIRSSDPLYSMAAAGYTDCTKSTSSALLSRPRVKRLLEQFKPLLTAKHDGIILEEVDNKVMQLIRSGENEMVQLRACEIAYKRLGAYADTNVTIHKNELNIQLGELASLSTDKLIQMLSNTSNLPALTDGNS